MNSSPLPSGHSPGSLACLGSHLQFASVFWPHCQGTEAHPDPGAQSLPSLTGTPEQATMGLEELSAWPPAGSHWVLGSFRKARKPPVPQVDGRPSCLCTHHTVPSASAYWHGLGPSRLLASGVLVASWPSAPFSPGWNREEGKWWGLAGAGAQTRAERPAWGRSGGWPGGSLGSGLCQGLLP